MRWRSTSTISGETVTNQRLRPVGFAGLLLLPALAHAQYVPTWLVLAALSPTLVLFALHALFILLRVIMAIKSRFTGYDAGKSGDQLTDT